MAIGSPIQAGQVTVDHCSFRLIAEIHGHQTQPETA